MANHEGKYNIKAASKLLGIQPGTLRAWERRYKVIAPKRNESGHRLYTEEHIQTLKWLINKVDNGFTISQAINLLDSNQSPVNNNKDIDDTGKPDLSFELMDKLLNALRHFDESLANDCLNKAFSLYTVDKVVFELLPHLLLKLQEEVKAGSVTAAEKQFIFSYFRSRIGMILHSLPVAGILPKAVTVCGPEESNELGLLIFSVFLRRKGFEVIYIGGSIDAGEIDSVLEKIKPQFLFFSCDLDPHNKKTLAMLDELSSKTKEIQICVIESAKSKVKYSHLNYEILEFQLQKWEKWLKENLPQKKQE
ncbi:MerR family transcriptional regulator [Metabacillus sp. Hm71]|uniref:MerR family transcriptional regulator n=1 Tax=Metabacillus sp. Hm71 TaxID=3450743 RepID=UPI003F442E10